MLTHKKEPLDAKKIGDAAAEIARFESQVAALREAVKAKEQELNSAECALSNARIAFTRLVDGHLAMRDLTQKPDQECSIPSSR